MTMKRRLTAGRCSKSLLREHDLRKKVLSETNVVRFGVAQTPGCSAVHPQYHGVRCAVVQVLCGPREEIQEIE
jgi:hypothetical protein